MEPTPTPLLLAEELALIALDPKSGRHALGTADDLNACLAGLLVAELQLPDRPASALLDAAAAVLADKGPKIPHVLSAMDRCLGKRLGAGTWESTIAELVRRGVIEPSTGGWRPSHPVVDVALRDAIVTRLREAAATDEPMDLRTALVLSMTGPAQLLELVAPDRATRKHARRRIDHGLDESVLQPVPEAVRKVLADAAAAVAAVAAVSVVAGASST
jgi:hypothetical protein